MNTSKTATEKKHEAKQQWLERVMASDLNHATKVFAWGVYSRMYGVKTVSNPGGKTIAKDTRVTESKHKVHRSALVDCGAMSIRLIKTAQGDWDSYEYTLCLSWDGSTADRGTSQKEGGSPLQGSTVPPTGKEGPTVREVPVPPTGKMNTPSQSTKEPTKEDVKEDKSNVPVVSDEPTVPSLDVKKESGVHDFFINGEYKNPTFNTVSDEPVGNYPSLNFERKKVGEFSYFILNPKTVTRPLNSMKDRSRDLVTKELQKAADRETARKSEKDQGREWLTHLIAEDGDVDADRAWSLFEDAQWRTDKVGRQRAAAAFFASTPVPAAPVQKQDNLSLEDW